MDIKKLASLVGGTVEGDGSCDITGLKGIESAEKGDMTFAVDEALLGLAEKSGASCILTTTAARKSSKPLIRVANPKLAFLMIYNILNKPELRPSFKDPSASVSSSARIGKNVWIGPNVSIEENVAVGDGTIIESNSVIKKNSSVGVSCRIYPNVTIYENTVIKNNVMLHAGAVIGADGFGYVKETGKIFKFPQLGKVIIEDNVEIGANTTIDRGSLSDTVIGINSKIDNLCQIAHNVKIGKNVIIAAQCGISGSTVVKDNVLMGGQCGLADNITIGENVILAAKSGIIGDVKDGQIMWGVPARPMSQTKRQMAVLAWLTKNFKLISKLVK